MDLLSNLRMCGISQFESLNSILSFQNNYQLIIDDYKKEVTNELSEIKEKLEKEMKELKIDYVTKTTNKRDELLLEKDLLEKKLAYYDEAKKKNVFQKIIHYFKRKRIVARKNELDTNFEYFVIYPFRKIKSEIEDQRNKINYIIENFETLIEQKVKQFTKEQEYIRSKIEDNNLLLIGAIGEDNAIKELTRLPDSYYLINNYKEKFYPPIYNRNENDRIFSVQIDHLVIGPSGVFIIETKNWSKDSIENYDLFSPVKQIRRASFTLFVKLNNIIEDLFVFKKSHHWGTKKIPIRNILLMIGEKPREEFQFVKVLTLNMIVNYIAYFEAIFSDEEVHALVKIIE